MSDELERFGPAEFQQFIACIATQIVGPGVQTFGSGRDGDRDLTFRGRIPWSGSAGEDGDIWDGYTVFQVKQKETISARPEDNAIWLASQIRSELKKWADGTSGRSEVPDQIVFVSNVPLTATPGSGGIDQIDKIIRDLIRPADSKDEDKRLKQIRGWKVWHRDQINNYVNAYPHVRAAFRAFLTPGDIINNLASLAGTVTMTDLKSGLEAHSRRAIVYGQWVYFDEGGASAEDKTSIQQVAVDVPVVLQDPETHTMALKHILDHGDMALHRSAPLVEGPKHIVLTGSPGNGKTTISKLLTQAYYAAFLDGTELAPAQQKIVDETRKALARLDCRLPRNRRWPFRIDLAEYAEANAHKIEPQTLLRWISEKINAASDVGDVPPSSLLSWRGQWPWLLVLDGLDEVAASDARRKLITEIEAFVAEVDQSHADLLMVITTRPTGFSEEISPGDFRRMDLGRMNAVQAFNYGSIVTKVRLKEDPERAGIVRGRLERALEDPAFTNLLQTPLQILITSIILESGTIPPDRYSLFWGYFDAIYKREANKKTSFANLLRGKRGLIENLHAKIGFELQVATENPAHSTAAISPEQLREATAGLLQRDVHEEVGPANQLVTDVTTAATHRLVLITPKPDGGYGFDVRSLQEVMAARYITTGSDDTVYERLTIAAPSPHWRNTWLFAAGRIFAENQRHRQEALVNLVCSLDRRAPERLGKIAPIAPALSLELVDDGAAASIPVLQDSLLGQAVLAFELPYEEATSFEAARALIRAASQSDRSRVIIRDALRTALGGTTTARETARRIQPRLLSAARESKATENAIGIGLLKAAPSAGSINEDEAALAALEAFKQSAEELTFGNDDQARQLLLLDAFDNIERLTNGPTSDGTVAILEALSDPVAATDIEVSLAPLMPAAPLALRRIHAEVLPEILRAPVGHLLRAEDDFLLP